MPKLDDYRIKPGEEVNLRKRATREDGGLKNKQIREQVRDLRRRLVKLQELLYAENKHALLVVFQAMDAGGKDSTIRSVLGPMNPQGVRVHSFKVPSTLERAHDYLWRIHQCTPGKGYVSVFNRSHYEDVLVVRVKNLVEPARWEKRYDHINAFEQLLADEGTTIVKFFLHISKDFQRKRLQRRLDRPDKHWKFAPADLKEREHWEDYQCAFEQALQRCSKPHAPWYAIPAEHRPYRDVLVASILIEHLEALKMKLPKPDFDPGSIVIPK